MVNENPKGKSNSDRIKLIPMGQYANPITPETPLKPEDIAYAAPSEKTGSEAKGIIATGISSIEELKQVMESTEPQGMAPEEGIKESPASAPVKKQQKRTGLIGPIENSGMEAQADSLIKTIFSAVYAVNQIGEFQAGYIYSKTADAGSRIDGELGVDYGAVKPKARARGSLDRFNAKYSTALPSLEIIVSKIGDSSGIDDSKFIEAKKKVEQAVLDYNAFKKGYSEISSALSKGDFSFDYQGALKELFSVVKASENNEFSFEVPIKDLFSYADKLSNYLGFLNEQLKIKGAYEMKQTLESSLSSVKELRGTAGSKPEMTYLVDFSAADAVFKHEAELNRETIEEKARAPQRKSFVQKFMEYFSKAPSNPVDSRFRSNHKM